MKLNAKCTVAVGQTDTNLMYVSTASTGQYNKAVEINKAIISNSGASDCLMQFRDGTTVRFNGVLVPANSTVSIKKEDFPENMLFTTSVNAYEVLNAGAISNVYVTTELQET
jgi:hypothetical protein